MLIRRYEAPINFDVVIDWLATASRMEQIVIAQYLNPIRVAWRTTNRSVMLRCFERIEAGCTVAIHRGAPLTYTRYNRLLPTRRRLCIKYRRRSDVPRLGYFDCHGTGWQILCDAAEAEEMYSSHRKLTSSVGGIYSSSGGTFRSLRGTFCSYGGTFYSLIMISSQIQHIYIH